MSGFFEAPNEANRERDIERKKYRSRSEIEFMYGKESVQDWYTWIRYEREKLGMENIGK